MQIPLHEFENHIDETILKRGLSYFNKGLVHEPEEITSGVFEAIVEGSDDYTVRLSIKNGSVYDYDCDCPYDMGPVCKHVAAMIFYLQKEELGLEQKPEPGPKAGKKKTAKAKPSGRQTVAEKLNMLLDKISHEDLKEFIHEKAHNDTTFRNYFLTTFVHLHHDESVEFYRKQIKSIIKASVGRKGFIYWDSARTVGLAVDALMDNAHKHFEQGNFKSTIFICCAVMEEMTEALGYADDSSGSIGDNIEDAFGIFLQLSEEELPADIRKFLFEYAVSSFKKGIYDGWDWHLGMMDLASNLLSNEAEAQIIMTLLDNAEVSEYSRERLQEIQYSILKKTKGSKEAEKFILQNLSNPGFRHNAIEKAVKSKDYKNAIAIAKEGIKFDTKDKPGLVKQWYNWLLKIAQAQKDTEKIIEYARYLFIDGFTPEQDYYKILKANVNEDEWTPFVEKVITDISNKGRWPDFYRLADIYIKEAWWDRLMKLVAANPSFQTIESYEKHLARDYRNELVGLYESAIIEFIEYNTGRNHYQTACKYLRRMLKLGAVDKVNLIIDNFRKQYPQRRALLEELAKV